MARQPGSRFASASDDRRTYHPGSPKHEAVKFMQNQCRRWLAEKEPDKGIEDAITMWRDATIGYDCDHEHGGVCRAHEGATCNGGAW